MTVYLCGASGSENGGIVGAAGDQTGREVRKTKWYQYSPKWTYVIRATDRAKADKIAVAAEQGAANNHIGYDQTNRNDLLKKLEKYGSMKAITVNTECDCTAFAACCLIQAGFSKAKLYSGGNLPYSRNFDTKALACGGLSKLTESRYLTSSDYLERGDILVCYGHHAEVVVSNGSKVLRNTWQYDGKHWCYLDDKGKMVRNKWVKDGKGWCWVAADGYWLKATKWLKVDGIWYHITNGYQDRNKWAKDSHGWCWLGSDGKWAKGQWVEWKDNWYYVKSNGYMAAGETVVIGSKSYKFDKSGKWVN